MAKEKQHKEGIDQGFHIGDRVRHKKNGYEGLISRFEWNGGIRSALCPSGKKNQSWYIYGLNEIEIIEPNKDIKPEPIEKGESDEEESGS
jgi:hypothetical protein